MMTKAILRIVYVPEVTDVYVAEDGENFRKVVLKKQYPEGEQYAYEVSVIPGTSKVKFVAVPDGVEKYFWTYSDDVENDGSEIGNGDEMNTCIWSVPEDFSSKTNLYLEEGHREVDYGFDLRDLYFKKDRDDHPMHKEAFEIAREDVWG